MTTSEEREKQARIEAEIRRDQGFTLARAIGQEGGGLFAGTSMVPAAQQALGAIRVLLDQHLDDTESCLRRALEQEIEGDLPLLDRFVDAPAQALAHVVRSKLDSEGALRELVRRADFLWGRDMGERPYFEVEGRPPHPDDPYTLASIRHALERLLAALV